MNAAELRSLSEALSWHVGQTFTPGHRETFAKAAEIIELLAITEDPNIRVARGPLCWIAKVGDEYISAPTLIDTLRRAREASKNA
jgi:hypothetical protein